MINVHVFQGSTYLETVCQHSYEDANECLQLLQLQGLRGECYGHVDSDPPVEEVDSFEQAQNLRQLLSH